MSLDCAATGPIPGRSGYKLVQLSINAPDRYIGTIALADNGAFVVGADPWIDDDLSQYSQDYVPEAQAQNFRLLDAIYSTATRNDVPSAVTGEAIMLVSKVFDLSALATKEDKLTIVFASPQAKSRTMPATCSTWRSVAATEISSASSTSPRRAPAMPA